MFTQLNEQKINASVLVTGCSSGIGEDAAITLHRQGWSVIATVRRQEDGDKLRAANIATLVMDYADSESVARAAQQVICLCDRKLFAVIHNGAYGQLGAVEDVPREAIEEQFKANVFGPIQLTGLLAPLLRQQNDARLIFISSVLGFVAAPYRGPYVASKFALEGFADTLRLELGNSPIKTILIEPGPIRTRFRKNAYDKLMQYIDIESSVHVEQYHHQASRLDLSNEARFTLPASAVTQKIRLALGPNPKSHYLVTVPTYVAAGIKRFLPTRVVDAILTR